MNKLKDQLKQLYSEWVLAGDHVLMPCKKIMTSSVELLCHWIKTIEIDQSSRDSQICHVSGGMESENEIGMLAVNV